MRVALLHYNNYYNRINRLKHTYLDYAPYLVNGSGAWSNPFTCDFKPNDGVRTQQIVNWDGDGPDYLIAYPNDYRERIRYYNQQVRLSDKAGTTVSQDGLEFAFQNDGTIKVTGVATQAGSLWLSETSMLSCYKDHKYIVTWPASIATTNSVKVRLYRLNAPVSTHTLETWICDLSRSSKYAYFTAAATDGGWSHYFKIEYNAGAMIPNIRLNCIDLSMAYDLTPLGTQTDPTLDEIKEDFPLILNTDTYNPSGGTGYAPNTQGTLNEIPAMRWFVLEADRTRDQQYRLTLYRDTISDFRSDALTAPAYVEKGHVPDTDPAVFNQEGLLVNQIKKGETLLKDITKIPWLVGYIDRGYAVGSPEEISINDKTESPDITVTSLSAWPWYTQLTGKYIDAGVQYGNIQQWGAGQLGTWGIVGPWTDPSKPSNQDIYDYLVDAGQYMDQSNILELQNLDGKTLYATDTGKYYRVSVNISFITQGEFVSVASGSAFDLAVKAATGSNEAVRIAIYNYFSYAITYQELDSIAGKIKISESRLHLGDAPYDMFTIPYADVDMIINNTTIRMTKDYAIRAAQSLAYHLKSGGYLYDLQLLPYCPIPYAYIDPDDGTISFSASEEDERYNLIVDADDNPESIIVWIERSTFSTALDCYIDVDDVKLTNECDMYRIVSPSYSGAFEFNPAKMGGVQYVHVDCTYLPINPYIHLCPNFKGLYGGDFRDTRGLIVGGDFSLPSVIDTWISYQANNKNYQMSFDRGIEHIEFGNNIARLQDKLNVTFGAAGSVGMGAAAGALSGNPVAAGAGAVLGAAGGIATGIMDLKLNEAIRQEALDYTRDNFAMSLQNIAARHNTLAKITAFTANNKIFPILEYYSCTDEEKEAVRNKIKYNGMTINRIGRLIDFLNGEQEQYIKGQLIRLETIPDDTHVVQALASELEKGVYTNVSGSI